MRKFVALCGFVGLILGLNGCAGGPYVPGGAIYTGLKGPVTATATTGNKKGRACGANYLGWIAVGDNSIAMAKKDGGIKKVAAVDYETFSVLGLFTEVCTIVSGK